MVSGGSVWNERGQGITPGLAPKAGALARLRYAPS